MSTHSDDRDPDGVTDSSGDSNVDSNVDARLRRSLGAQGAAPYLSSDLIANAATREAPRLVNRQRRIQAAGGMTLAVAAVTVGALVVSLPTQRAPLFLAASSSSGNTSAQGGGAASSSLKMGADAAPSDMRIAQWIDYRYEAGADLGTEASTGSVYQLKRTGTAESRLRDVAGALGVSGEAKKTTYSDPAYPTWMVGPEDGSAASVTITWAGTGDWWYNDPTAMPQVVCAAVPPADAAGGPAIDVLPVCEVPPAPAGASKAPSESDARAEALGLFGKTGLDVAADRIRVTTDPGQTTATTNLTVDGTQTALEWTVAWAPSGKIAWASGHSIDVVDRGSFGTISATDAVKRLSDYRWFGAAGPEFQGGVRLLAADMLRSADATGSPVSPDALVGPDSPVTTDANGGTATDPQAGGTKPTPQGVDPRDDPIIEPGPGKTEEPVAPPTAEPVPAPAPSVPPTAEPLPEPTIEPQPLPEKPKVVVVTVDKATSTLLMMWDADGNAWLVPGFAMQHPDGWWNTIVSLEDGVIQLPKPIEIAPLDGTVIRKEG